MDKLPQLNLSSDQQNIINAHASQAVMQIVGCKYTAANKDDAVSNTIFQQGMLEMCKTLLTYDSDMLKKAQEAPPQPDRANEDLEG